MTPHTRQPAVAGLFYPADPVQLRATVRAYVAQAKAGVVPAPKALIAPHAGYIYSGPVAGSAYAQLLPAADRISRVVILAPAHRLAFAGIAHSSDRGFVTPLGEISVDCSALATIDGLPQVIELDAAFDNEHSIEVHLPFLQEVLTRFQIVPLLVGDAQPEEIEEILDLLWGGAETLLLVSSDLSHYLSYRKAREVDLASTRAIETLNPENLGYHSACGRIPVNGLLLAARQHHLEATTLDLRNSGDTAGPRDRVVGYGAYAFA